MGLISTDNEEVGTDSNLFTLGQRDDIVRKTRFYTIPTNPFEVAVTHLTPGTKYYYRAFIENGDNDVDHLDNKVGYGQIEEVVTLDIASTHFDVNVELSWDNQGSVSYNGDGFMGMGQIDTVPPKIEKILSFTEETTYFNFTNIPNGTYELGMMLIGQYQYQQLDPDSGDPNTRLYIRWCERGGLWNYIILLQQVLVILVIMT